VIGANDIKAENKIRGMTCAGAYVDEATLLPEVFWEMLRTRMRVVGARAYASTNPDSPNAGRPMVIPEVGVGNPQVDTFE
jgi:hypothetical protein